MTHGGSWPALITEDAAAVLAAIRGAGHGELHDQLVLFIRALAIEAGAAADADKTQPGLPMEEGRYNVDVPRLPVIISYTLRPGVRQVHITDMIWLG